MADFVYALRAMKKGKFVARRDWNLHGKTYLFIMNGKKVGELLQAPQSLTVRDMFMIVTRSGKIGAWTPAQCDLLANDWFEMDVADQKHHPKKA